MVGNSRADDQYLFQPPKIRSHEDLVSEHKKIKDAIIVSIDLECADHDPNLSEYDLLSEVGMSWYDPRDDKNSGRRFAAEGAIPQIRSFHCIIRKWKNFIDKSCYADRHCPGYRSRPHVAQPYSCVFAKSYICNRQKALNKVEEKMKWFSTKSLTWAEVAAGHRRQVIVLYWDARLETRVFAKAGLDITAYGAVQWDFQLLSMFGGIFGRFKRTRTSARVVLYTLGVNAKRSPCVQDSDGWIHPPVNGYHFLDHNATNDCWMAVAGFLQVLSMARQKWKWKRWVEEEKKGWELIFWEPDVRTAERRKGRSLKPLDMSWLDVMIGESNSALSPPPEKWPKKPCSCKGTRESCCCEDARRWEREEEEDPYP